MTRGIEYGVDMKKFILSKMHIGYEAVQNDIMEQAVKYIRQNTRPGDQV